MSAACTLCGRRFRSGAWGGVLGGRGCAGVGSSSSSGASGMAGCLVVRAGRSPHSAVQPPLRPGRSTAMLGSGKSSLLGMMWVAFGSRHQAGGAERCLDRTVRRAPSMAIEAPSGTGGARRGGGSSHRAAEPTWHSQREQTPTSLSSPCEE